MRFRKNSKRTLVRKKVVTLVLNNMEGVTYAGTLSNRVKKCLPRMLNLCDRLEHNTYGLGYKFVMKVAGRPRPTITRVPQKIIMETLSPKSVLYNGVAVLPAMQNFQH